MKPVILWLRRDLRLYDNPALSWACEQDAPVIPVYIHAPEEEQPWAPGGASRWWLHHSLQQLEHTLQAYGLKLYRLSGDSTRCLADLCRLSGAGRVTFNRLYEPHLAHRDERVVEHLQARGITTRAFHSGLFFNPGGILNKQGAAYRVYTPFYRTARPLLDSLYGDDVPVDVHRQLKRLQATPVLSGLREDRNDLMDPHPWHEKLQVHWQPGEQQAHDRLETFVEQDLAHYSEQRDLPALDATSRLSPALHFGELTVQQIYGMLRPMLAGTQGARATESAERFLGQLLWREFAAHVLWHFPHSSDKPMDLRYKPSFWRRARAPLERWQRGETGIPLVDAGMKQLWETGWMHNRVRMVVASFLTKNLGLNWLEGAHWFWDTLVDADLANNSMGWQWVAGCGVDAAPYYRIFNPNTQSRRFDAELRYADRWAPEHRALDYPPPMVDLSTSREQALRRYRQHISRQD